MLVSDFFPWLFEAVAVLSMLPSFHYFWSVGGVKGGSKIVTVDSPSLSPGMRYHQGAHT